MATIQSYVQPHRLYRYRSLEDLEREVQAITKSYLYCARYPDLNDPMEGRFVASRVFRKNVEYPQVREAILDEKSQIGMCSFSEVHDHELMWAHYANHFKGICIAYSLSRLLKNLDDQITFARMHYNETVPTLHRVNKESEYFARMVLSYKNHRWLHEREWRMFATPGRAIYHDASCVTHVYLGHRIEPGGRERVTSALQTLDIKTSNMVIHKYSIKFAT